MVIGKKMTQDFISSRKEAIALNNSGEGFKGREETSGEGNSVSSWQSAVGSWEER